MSQRSTAEASANVEQDNGTNQASRQDSETGAVTSEEVSRLEKAMHHLRCIWVEQVLLPM